MKLESISETRRELLERISKAKDVGNQKKIDDSRYIQLSELREISERMASLLEDYARILQPGRVRSRVCNQLAQLNFHYEKTLAAMETGILFVNRFTQTKDENGKRVFDYVWDQM